MKELAPLNKYFAKYKWRIAAGIAFVIAANALNVCTPYITGQAANLIAGSLQQGTGHSLQAISRDILFLFLKYLAVALLAGCFTFLMRQMIIVVSRLIEFDLKNEIYEHYQQLDLAFYRKNNTGDLMNRITEDVSRVRMYIGPAIMYTTNLLFTIVFAISFMLYLDKTLTLYVLIPLPILSFLIYFINEKIEKASTSIQAKLSDLTTTAQETYSGIRVVQAYTRENEMLQHFEQESELYKTKQLALAKIDAIYFPSMTFLIGCSIIIVVYAGGMHVGSHRINVGVLVSFLGYVNMLMWPVSSLGWTASLIQRAIASQKRINEFLHYQPTVKNEGTLTNPITGHIRFENVSFTYPDTGIQALKNISFQLEPGQRIAIIGKTGSGKTTIADLLLRMYHTTTGNIIIDGHDIQSYHLQSLRKQIGFVPQDVFLFSETITENISFGIDTSDTATAARYAHLASIGKEIESFPKKYNTMVGERGVTLSGGQKQRISIARALIKQPNVLVLDDSLSAVDTATEKQIQQNLDEVLRGKTAIIITHRIFSLIHFDQILVLENGIIAEQGTHDDLLKAGGIYFDIYQKQLQEHRQTADA